MISPLGVMRNVNGLNFVENTGFRQSWKLYFKVGGTILGRNENEPVIFLKSKQTADF